MSFSSLPPELVHQVIESTVAHTFHSTTYKGRQQTLRSLCLVSKLFRSIAQPLLFEIVKVERLKDVGKLPTGPNLGGGTRTHGILRWLVVDWMDYEYGNRTQEEKDRFSESLLVFESVRNLTVALIEMKSFVELLSVTSPNLSYLHITDYWFEMPEAVHLPNLRDLMLFDVSSQLFSSLVNSAVVPNLQNFGVVDNSNGSSADRLNESKTSAFLLQLKTLYLDIEVWLKLDNSFRQSVASRTLVNVDYGGFQEACNTIVHARLEGTWVDEEGFSHEEFSDELDSYASFIERSPSLSLKSLYLDSSFSDQSNLPQSTQSSMNNLSRICQERKIDLVFDQIAVSYEIDPCISAAFIRRQKSGIRNISEADRMIPGHE